MVDLMSLLSDALIGSFQMFMLNDFGKNMFPYRIKTCWKRILIYGVTALVILSVNHIESSQTPQVVLDYQATDFNGELLVNWDYVIDAFDVEMIHSMFSENIKDLRLLIYS